jgi:hypothetical protein
MIMYHAEWMKLIEENFKKNPQNYWPRGQPEAEAAPGQDVVEKIDDSNHGDEQND